MVKSTGKRTREQKSNLSDAEALRLSESGFWDEKRVCEHLSIGRTTLYQLRKKSEIPFIRMGRSLRFAKAAVIEYGKQRLQQVN